MAKIVHLSGLSTETRKPLGPKSTFREYLGFPLCVLLVLASMPMFLGLGVMFLTSRMYHRLTGRYPLNLTLRLGECAE